MNKVLYIINYTNRLNGERCTYMDVGFETEEEAQRELDKILREAQKRKYTLQELIDIPSGYVRSFMVGIRWKIKPIRVRPV